jgi:hypothetical protein
MSPIYHDPEGKFTAFICDRGGRRRPCQFCRTGYVTKLCDFPAGPRGKTCDAGMCDKCATNVGPDRDHCPRHKHLQPPQADLPLGGAE